MRQNLHRPEDLVERLQAATLTNGDTDIMWEAADEIQRLRERLGPRGLEVVEISGAGHYVNEKVKAEIECLRAALKQAQEALA